VNIRIRQSTKVYLTVIYLLVFLFLASCSVSAVSKIENLSRGLHSDTWVAVDELGRQLRGFSECKLPRKERYVGVFYWSWHHADHAGPYDVTKILAANPESPQWGPILTSHHWGEPELGYYLSDDPYVIARHASMLSDAGVDVIFFDTTNSPWTFQKQYEAICRTFQQVRNKGNVTPQIAFVTPFNDPEEVVQKLYDNLYGKGLYSELWFKWDGKPLILADPDCFKSKPDIYNFFTFRKPMPSYFLGPNGPNQWGWLEVFPQHVFYDKDNHAEQIAVGVAQNAMDSQITMMSHKKGAMGRSWHDGAKDVRKDAVNYGFNFAEQWERALKVDPELIFITGWNEWIAIRFDKWHIYDGDDCYYPDTIFVDQYDHEYSRDIEPMSGGHSDNYYYQMVDYIRKFKGAGIIPEVSVKNDIVIDGVFSDWQKVEPEFRDTIGDTAHRDHPGYGSLHYRNTTGRNDFVSLKVGADAENIYFYAKTSEAITPNTDKNWMLLFVDSDMDRSTGWEGYDYLVNSEVADSTTTLKRFVAGTGWENVGRGQYKAAGNEIEISISRHAIGFIDKKTIFDFHWADNIQKLDIVEFGINGDSAPNRRFNFRYINNLTVKREKMTEKIPDRLVVMTLDDGTCSQAAAGELLKEYGFGATFFISDADFKFPGDDKLNWQQIRKLSDDGFEIGSHTYTHPDVTKLSDEKFIYELKQLEQLCVDNGIAVPRTFAYPGYHVSRKAANVLKRKGYLFARGGSHVPYDPSVDNSMMIPTCASWSVLDDDKFLPPGNTMDYFVSSVRLARDGKIVVLTFHGVSGMGDPQTSLFKRYLDYLKENNYSVIAMRDLVEYVSP